MIRRYFWIIESLTFYTSLKEKHKEKGDEDYWERYECTNSIMNQKLWLGQLKQKVQDSKKN